MAWVTAEMQVQSLAQCSGLSIQHCPNCSIGPTCGSDSIPGLGTSIGLRCSQKKKKTGESSTTLKERVVTPTPPNPRTVRGREWSGNRQQTKPAAAQIAHRSTWPGEHEARATPGQVRGPKASLASWQTHLCWGTKTINS